LRCGWHVRRKRQLAVDLATVVMTIEQVPDIPIFRKNTAAFVHDRRARRVRGHRAILPGISATRIFTKIDRGDSIPDARRPPETVARISPFCMAELPYP
jgi:hypothetical protein